MNKYIEKKKKKHQEKVIKTLCGKVKNTNHFFLKFDLKVLALFLLMARVTK